ncbi:MAG TPA: hypothetical protein PK129_01290 [Cellvibrionaceae bacterium]|nr:hypothetical protein [Cellvibrionaceae bacterium]
MSYAIYGLVKYIAYSLWCYIGIRIFTSKRCPILLALMYGATRWFLGLFFGFAVAVFAGPISTESAASYYFGIYTPLRIVEWGVIVKLLNDKNENRTGIFAVILWIMGGILISFATDAVSPAGIEGRFCIGRCLC